MCIALTHVTVIDATGAPPRSDQTVLIDGGRIAAIGPYDRTELPERARIVDMTGKYVIPGLADMHVHGSDDERIHPPIYVANGITTVREMWGKPLLHEWRSRISSGDLLGPRWVIGSKIVDGSPSLWTGMPIEDEFVAAATPEDGRRAVCEAKDEGADFVKVYSRLSLEVYTAVTEEAERLDIPVMGHLPDAVPMVEAVARGQRSFEHVHGVWPATSREDEALIAAMAKLAPEPPYYNNWFHVIHDVEWEGANTYSPYKAAAVFERLAAAEAAYCPTLVLHEVLDIPYRVDLQDPRLEFVPADMETFWAYVVDDLYAGGRTGEAAFQHRMLFQRRLETVAAMEAAGVEIIAGTDVATAFIFPGFSLHDELALYVEAGMSPLRALQTATIAPARFLGRAHELGTVEPGKLADLVVLNANPLADIRSTRDIHAVVLDGRLITSEERLRLLESVKAAARPA